VERIKVILKKHLWFITRDCHTRIYKRVRNDKHEGIFLLWLCVAFIHQLQRRFRFEEIDWISGERKLPTSIMSADKLCFAKLAIAKKYIGLKTKPREEVQQVPCTAEHPVLADYRKFSFA